MIVEGINVIRELLVSDSQIEKIIVTKDDKSQDVNKLLTIARQKNIFVEMVDKNTMDKITKSKNPQGVIAFVPSYRYVELKEIFDLAESLDEKPFIIILDGISDPHNIGAILRSAECAGVHGVIIPENRSGEVNETVYKTSSGAVSHIKVCRVTNLTRTIKELKDFGVWIYALEAGNKKIYESDFTYPTALVVGSEGKGVSRLVLENCDEIVSLTIRGKVNSLNASNAAAIAIYEVVRQRGV